MGLNTGPAYPGDVMTETGTLGNSLSSLGIGWVRVHSKKHLGQLFLRVSVIRSSLSVLHLQASSAEGLMSSTCDVDLNFVFCAKFFQAH